MSSAKDRSELEPDIESEFADITDKIRPLPENVVPSEFFRERMRQRLLNLADAAKPKAA
jgi:hypothetical protein